ncbi:MurR/RpiR family transcriptional regulator [Roseobacter weihaiensis]|uniref:MurR/RpiR family transcriptional regulator n=1 Tax=Roseobacter weihaiensis TaxID=2763262 RepID=UPI001D0A871E|nr:MurR/RpiR family transcriptional regulator [Roseobacter sp. H9]
MDDTVPTDYEDFMRLVHERHDGMSKTYQHIALYLTQNTNEVAVRSLNAIAKDSGVHASSFVRFSQSLGFGGFKDLQHLFKARLTTAAPGFTARQAALTSELSRPEVVEGGSFLEQLVTRDQASLQELLELTRQTDLDRAAQVLNKAETIYLIGQLRSAPVSELFRYILTMLGKKAVLLDASGGLSTHMSRVLSSSDALVAISFRFYANEVVNIVEEVGQKQIPIIGISDSTLSPIAKYSNPLFVIPEREYVFSRSLAAPVCLAQAILLSLAALQQGQSEPRIPTVTTA